MLSGASSSVAEWKSGVFKLKVRPQPGHPGFHNRLCPVAQPDSVLSGFYSRETVYLLRWFQNNSSLWSGLFCQKSHSLGWQFSVLHQVWVCCFNCCYCRCVVVVSVRVCYTTAFFASTFPLQLVFSFFSAHAIDFDNTLKFCNVEMLISVFQHLTVWHVASEFSFEIFLVLRKSNTFIKRDTIFCYVPFSKWLWFMAFFRCGGIFTYMNFSMITWVATLNAGFINFWSPSRK